MMTTTIEAAKDAVKGRLDPALDSLQERMRGARRAMTHGRHAAEDLAAGTALQVRRRPFTAMAIVAAGGALAGCLFGFAVGRWGARR
jgi:ElaB/YqjD/DUF883 family membrane-anchored ribosome-binding protein